MLLLETTCVPLSNNVHLHPISLFARVALMLFTNLHYFLTI